VRILLALVLLGMTASCVVPPPEAAVPMPPPGSVPDPAYVANPLTGLFQAPMPGRLTLSNFTYESARVQAVVTPYPDCEVRQGADVSDFEIPLNGTRVIGALPGADVCWRRALPAPAARAGWTDWNRVFTSSGRSIDSQL
jgi:hypothetical protein